MPKSLLPDSLVDKSISACGGEVRFSLEKCRVRNAIGMKFWKGSSLSTERVGGAAAG